MSILDLVEEWATEKGWWTYKSRPFNGGFLYLAKSPPDDGYGYITLWVDDRGVRCYHATLHLDNRCLVPADPDFFLNLEQLVTTKTK